MTAVILDGKHVAQLTEEQLSVRVEALKAKSDGRTPVLATILVGDDPASATYVKMKATPAAGSAWSPWRLNCRPLPAPTTS
jgi:methylenetetrahydrofolate dehydrogenase (NADP+)/methenyltetrahydrofolate cyclohydrolase